MPLRNLLKKKEKIEEKTDTYSRPSSQPQQLQQAFDPPQVKIFRSDTHTEELLSPPSFPDESAPAPNQTFYHALPTSQEKSFHRVQESSWTSEREEASQKQHRSLSDRLHLSSKNRSKSAGATSSHVPAGLPEIPDAYTRGGDEEEKQAEWEQRATVLVSANRSPNARPELAHSTTGMSQLSIGESQRRRSASISDAESDVNIQDAIRLHEEGKLEEATAMFKQLADRGNVISQVLYGLSLRHGWGCQKDEKQAFVYLASAASDSAALEQEALKSGLKKGGSAKGELVLAIFELGNCYRFGWGTPIDKPAARQYYECAGFMGDIDVRAFPELTFSIANMRLGVERGGLVLLGGIWRKERQGKQLPIWYLQYLALVKHIHNIMSVRRSALLVVGRPCSWLCTRERRRAQQSIIYHILATDHAYTTSRPAIHDSRPHKSPSSSSLRTTPAKSGLCELETHDTENQDHMQQPRCW